MPKLFHLYPHKQALLSKVLTITSEMYHSYAKGGTLRTVAQFVNNPVDRAKYEQHCNNLEKVYGESYQVISAIFFHSKHYFNKENPWANEFEVPLDIFERGINTAIQKLTQYKTLIGAYDTYAENYGKMIDLLNEILEYRRRNV